MKSSSFSSLFLFSLKGLGICTHGALRVVLFVEGLGQYSFAGRSAARRADMETFKFDFVIVSNYLHSVSLVCSSPTHAHRSTLPCHTNIYYAGLHVASASQELTMQPKMILNFCFSSLLLSARIIDTHHRTCFAKLPVEPKVP